LVRLSTEINCGFAWPRYRQSSRRGGRFAPAAATIYAIGVVGFSHRRRPRPILGLDEKSVADPAPASAFPNEDLYTRSRTRALDVPVQSPQHSELAPKPLNEFDRDPTYPEQPTNCGDAFQNQPSPWPNCPTAFTDQRIITSRVERIASVRQVERGLQWRRRPRVLLACAATGRLSVVLERIPRREVHTRWQRQRRTQAQAGVRFRPRR
jgi:hypothetical protein